MPEDPPTTAITCPVCFRTSYNLTDVREGYCGHCHDWTGLDRRPARPPSKIRA